MASNPLREMLAHPYFIAVGIPLVLILIGATAKKLVRGTGWQRQDFFLGMELALAAVSSALMHMYETALVMKRSLAASQQDVTVAVSFIAFSLLFLMVIMTMHQDQQRRRRSRRSQWLWLGIVANLIGVGLLASFMILVKGVQP